MGRKRTRVQTRCDPKTIDKLDDYIDDNEISESEAVRRLIRTGLHIHGYKIEDYEQVQRAALGRYLVALIALLGLFGVFIGVFIGAGVF